MFSSISGSLPPKYCYPESYQSSKLQHSYISDITKMCQHNKQQHPIYTSQATSFLIKSSPSIITNPSLLQTPPPPLLSLKQQLQTTTTRQSSTTSLRTPIPTPSLRLLLIISSARPHIHRLLLPTIHRLLLLISHGWRSLCIVASLLWWIPLWRISSLLWCAVWSLLRRVGGTALCVGCVVRLEMCCLGCCWSAVGGFVGGWCAGGLVVFV